MKRNATAAAALVALGLGASVSGLALAEQGEADRAAPEGQILEFGPGDRVSFVPDDRPDDLPAAEAANDAPAAAREPAETQRSSERPAAGAEQPSSGRAATLRADTRRQVALRQSPRREPRGRMQAEKERQHFRGARRSVGGTLERSFAEGQRAEDKSLSVRGYLQPEVLMTMRPQAHPVDRLTYSTGKSKAGIVASSQPWNRWTVRAAINGVFSSSVAGGTSDAELRIEEASIRYRPIDSLRLAVGQQRVPMTLDQLVADADMLFPRRSETAKRFAPGSRFGLNLAGALADRARVDGGVFWTAEVLSSGLTRRGPLYVARLEVDALPAERKSAVGGPHCVDCERPRVAFAGSVSTQPTTIYDQVGYPARSESSRTYAAAAQVGYRGLLAQAEILRAIGSDPVRARPDVATGAHSHLSYYRPLSSRIAIAGLARLGWTQEQQGFDPRNVYRAEAAITTYLLREGRTWNAHRFTLGYMAEIRSTEKEDAHGLMLQAHVAL